MAYASSPAIFFLDSTPIDNFLFANLKKWFGERRLECNDIIQANSYLIYDLEGVKTNREILNEVIMSTKD